jgi:hypothetical protein
VLHRSREDYGKPVTVPKPGAAPPPTSLSGAPVTAPKPLDLPRLWTRRTTWIGLALGVLVVIIFSVVYKPVDFSVYRFGGEQVTHGLRLYLTRYVRGHDREWFTYTPFAAVLFVPLAILPELVSQVIFQLLSVAALGVAGILTLRLAGYVPTRTVAAAAIVVGLTLEPMYHTLFLGQINLILFALIMIDVWRIARGRTAGVCIGITAAIKLIPLIFIPMLLLARRWKDAMFAAGTFLTCVCIGYAVNPQASGLYWHHLVTDTARVGAGYISNQSPFALVVRLTGDTAVGHWYLLFPILLGTVSLAVAAVLARHRDWLGAVTVTGTGGLLVSPVSWTHHWVWVLPALVLLWQGGKRARIGAASGYALFVLAPMWFTPRQGGPSEYGFHGLVTAVANCYLVAGLAFLGYMSYRAYLLVRAGARPPQGGATATSAQPPQEFSPVGDLQP